MILPDFTLPSRVNQHWCYSGIDCIENCLDKKHFKSYSYDIDYKYNSRGFRDAEWPDSAVDLKKAIWCVGDSFTVGVGNPTEHTWVYQVGKQLDCQTINVSMDGASNYWIARKTLDIINHISPKVIIIQWSYIHRAELNDTTVSDEHRRLQFAHCGEYLYTNIELGYRFIKLIQQVELVKQQTRIIHSFIPEFGINTDMLNIWNQISGPDWPPFPQSLEEFDALPSNIVDELINLLKVYDIFKIYYGVHHKIEYVPEIKKLDLARDGLHYDILTAQQFATSVRELLNGNC